MKNSDLKLTILTLIFCLISNFNLAQTSLFSYNQYTNNEGDTLNYRLLYPDVNPHRKFPLVIFLHGSGERGNDNQTQLKWGVKNFSTAQSMKTHPAFVIAPQCPENMDWVNLSDEEMEKEIQFKSEPSKAMKLVIELIHEFAANNPVDTNRIYITGISSGGVGTFDAIIRYPDLFAAAAPVCGIGDISKAASIAHIPIWIFLGSEDPVFDPIFSLKMVEALSKAGAHPGFTQYPGVGHFSWLAAYSDPLLMEWLFRQHR